MIHRILKGEPMFDISFVDSTYFLEEDAGLYEICKGNPLEEYLLMACSTRISLSNKVAELKLQSSPFDFLHTNNDFMKLITHRDIECEIIQSFTDPIYLKIIELSKIIQIRCLEKLTQTYRIGYLFGKGTFSHEAITKNFRGNHIPFANIHALRNALELGEVDAILLPTYNSIIGEIFRKNDEYCGKGSVDHPVELSLYSNTPITKSDTIDTLYVETHIQRECEQYIEKNLTCKNIVLVKSSVEGCIQCIQNTNKVVATISSRHNSSAFLHTIDTNLVDHNITTFSLFMMQKGFQTPPNQVEVSYFSCIDSHYC
jgi:hypothetical protein